jgi:hypothetical protein
MSVRLDAATAERLERVIEDDKALSEPSRSRALRFVISRGLDAIERGESESSTPKTTRRA